MTTHNWLCLEPPVFERTQQTFSQIEKVLHFKSECGDIFRLGGQVDYRLFSSEIREDCQARKLNKEEAMDRCKWRKMIKEAR